MKKQKYLKWLNITGLIAILILVIIMASLQDYLVILLSVAFLILFIFFIINMIYYFNVGFINEQKINKIIPDIENQIEKNFKYGYLIYDENERIIFINNYLSLVGFNHFVGKKIIDLKLDEGKLKSEFLFNNKNYETIKLTQKKIILFRDISEISAYRQQIDSNWITVFYIDKYYDQKILEDELKRISIDIKINTFLREWISKNKGIFKIEGSNDKNVLLISKWKYLRDDILSEKLLNDLIKLIKEENQKNVSISIGVSYGNFELNKLSDRAKKSLELSKTRGGNQITVFHNDNHLENIGEKSSNITEQNIRKLTIFAEYLNDNLNKYFNFIIISHDNADIDAVVSAIGIARYINNFSVKAEILIYNFDNSASKLFMNLSDNLKKLFIDPRELKNKLNNKTAILIVDVSNTYLIKEWGDIKSKVSNENIFLIDHHTINEKSIDLVGKNSYVDISASSASEIIANIFNINSNLINSLTKEEADLLISGIYTDSKNLTRNVGPTTCDVLSYLTHSGGEIDKAVDISRNDLEYINLLIELFNSVQKPITTNILLGVIPQEQLLDDIIVSKLADELMNYNNIDASFVFARIDNNKYKLSARSNQNINVQKICESLGGGGHHNIAAVTFDFKIDQYDKILNKIKNIIKKNERKIDNISK
ncbi:/ / putative bifunctional signaling protein/50S ribosomal protein L9 / 30741:32711 Forward [Candidatus Hepatoplasma crinochetorum]|uniref:/ / putative bifunctional signaling protein/50S ribosomal protein L9 / 30741:32711 Forward n=1 Tax=Candidatus Hepatoplasma crinochetorum TaxID=295596 RepID=A0A0G7ZLX7_9MOLU|nr:/ / putative bifunctional signaling protein/50S ribosomal protein L9 / 30741:32711 Forward [Candidatus Hepatoplasma crinochetorum]